MMNYGQVFAQYESELEALGEEKESLAYVFKDCKGWNQTDFILQQPQEIAEEDLTKLEEIMQQLRQHIPAQYITGKAYFADLILSVDERVLIPRPETEELVKLILKENQHRSSAKLLDIGTGSGAIALALAKAQPDWQVWASDISEDALNLAQENATVNQAAVTFLQSDIFSHISDKYDIIVSNPPYISLRDQDEVEQNVLEHEPHLALFADNDGLAFYQKLALEAEHYLKLTGKIYLEIGYKQGEAVSQLFERQFPNKRVRLLQDSFGKDRMVVVDDG
ncbi:putative protoporphyrinogen oxidase [Streptococcus mutans LJ23]|nr:peptide chain release factor N(5)-glutamine methyltransferase [Streptococcus mutans]MCB4950315.1 peptide chain release factor N(5)-glutamine methyltransferase [Streptococcus mutans]MCB4955803.1 peptide chain release factor N(5)-glutamine methyltransferase [Streptococcus mutans]BAL69285.1 putative protoporphyrinogen oxidase [Streptococcus mutans LJ23]